MSLIKSVAFLTSPSQCLMHVLSIFFYQDELKRLKNIERNTNRLKELGRGCTDIFLLSIYLFDIKK